MMKKLKQWKEESRVLNEAYQKLPLEWQEYLHRRWMNGMIYCCMWSGLFILASIAVSNFHLVRNGKDMATAYGAMLLFGSLVMMAMVPMVVAQHEKKVKRVLSQFHLWQDPRQAHAAVAAGGAVAES